MTTTKAPAVVEHFMVVEVDGLYGKYRQAMPEAEVDAYIQRVTASGDEGLSDLYCSTRCEHPEHDSDADWVRWREEDKARDAVEAAWERQQAEAAREQARNNPW